MGTHPDVVAVAVAVDVVVDVFVAGGNIAAVAYTAHTHTLKVVIAGQGNEPEIILRLRARLPPTQCGF